jgi:toxin-antitoxin system PIN domain toxin
VKLPDANVLLYAVDESAHHHASARAWLEAALSGSETIAFCWSALLAFVRLGTRPVVFEDPLSADEALDVVEGWLDQPSATVVNPTPRHTAVLRDLLGPLGAAGNLTSDAHLAALAIEHGAELCSYDADFARFAGLRWSNPGRP